MIHDEKAENEKTRENVLGSNLTIDAVICIDGTIAFGAGRAILSSNKKIPDDIIFAEFGDNDVISRLGVPFYTVNQNPHKIGESAVDLLINYIE